MSRSVKKNWRPHGILGDQSMSGFRTTANRKMRRMAKMAIDAGDYDDAPTNVREVSNVWDGPRDGMTYLSRDVENFLPDEYLDAMKRK